MFVFMMGVVEEQGPAVLGLAVGLEAVSPPNARGYFFPLLVGRGTDCEGTRVGMGVAGEDGDVLVGVDGDVLGGGRSGPVGGARAASLAAAHLPYMHVAAML